MKSTRAMLRRRAGLTQLQLARLSGISASQICLWERGEISLLHSDVARIARAIDHQLRRFATPRTCTEITSALTSEAVA
jgi:transcriptional regulator with XRE-family HTH domain